MTLSDEMLINYLQFARRVNDSNIFDAVARVLSAQERGSIEAHASVVTRKKAVLVVKRPERLKEIILIGKENPEIIRRYSLTLQRKQNRGKI